MTLTYRGVPYQTSDLTINTEKSGLNATYRGQSYQLNGSWDFIFKPLHNLTYRGVKYNNSTENTYTSTVKDLQPVFN